MFYAIACALIFPLAVDVLPLKLSGVEAAVASAHTEGNFDGVVVVSQEGQAPLIVATGLADRMAKTANRPDTLFRLGSLTKQVTALMIMQEVTSGHLRLDQKVGEFVKSLPDSSGQVTIRQLLQHVSGLRNPSDGPDDAVPPFYLRTDPAVTDMTRVANGYCSETPKRAPGQSFEYNNCDYIILGAVLEAITGKGYPKILRERVTEPLGLRSWGMFPPTPPRAPARQKAIRKTDRSNFPKTRRLTARLAGYTGTRSMWRSGTARF